MTVRPPRLDPGPLTRDALDRAFIELAGTTDRAILALLLAGAVMLEVPAAEAASGFTFPTSRRKYTVPGAGAGSPDIRVFSTGETIVQHGLGRRPTGRIVVGQAASSSLFDLDVSALSPGLDPAQFVAFQASVTTTFRVVLF